MDKAQKLAYIRKHWGKKTPEEIARHIGAAPRTMRRYRRELNLPKYIAPTADDHVEEHRLRRKAREVSRDKRQLADRVVDLEEKLEAALAISKFRASYKIPQGKKSRGSEAVAVALASDWHIEEVVHRYQVAGLNEFNEEVCRTRVRRYFRHLLKLVKKEKVATKISTLVLWLGGDFISGSIHEELVEGNRLLPIDAILECREHIVSGIKYLLANSDLNVVVPTSSGNHGRTTHKVHVSTESGNSLEYFMYASIAKEFEKNPRVEVLLNKGYHTYVKVWPNFTIRFHHGHSMRYLGGQSGIAGPATRMIKNWNEGRHADLDCFGHFHQLYRHGTFVGNGSLIGPGAYSWRGGFSPERPQQAFFLVDRDLGLTGFHPIILTEDR